MPALQLRTPVLLLPLLLFFYGIGLCAPARAASEEIVLAGRQTTVWAPPVAATRQPLLLFSHGYGGCSTQSRFLTEALARAGYWVFAPNHRDARCSRGAERSGAFSLQQFRTPEQWNEQTYADRRDDLFELVQALRREARFEGRIDLSRIGLIGHSLGGYTVLGLAGGWASWRMPGVKAVLALSPFSQPYIIHNRLADIGLPLMLQGGSRDFGLTPAMSKNAGAYDQARAPKYFVELRDAGHFAWTDLNRRYAQSVIDYSAAFFEHYINGAATGSELTRIRSDVSRLWYDSEFGRRERSAADAGQNAAQPQESRAGSRD